MRILGFIIISLALSIGAGRAQDKDFVPDTVKGKFVPSGLRLGFDLVSAGQAVVVNGLRAITQGSFRELQFSADVDFYRYFFNVEYGIFDYQWTRSDAYYINKGTHFKIGPDVNFLQHDPDGSALFFGFRYGFSNFSDELVYDYGSTFWGNGSNRLENDRVHAHWLELTTGLKVRLTKIIWLGYTARFKFGRSNLEDRQLIPHWIPGYGRAAEKSFWGFDYWLIVKIPFKKEKKPPKKEE